MKLKLPQPKCLFLLPAYAFSLNEFSFKVTASMCRHSMAKTLDLKWTSSLTHRPLTDLLLAKKDASADVFSVVG